jgi:type III secretory pathway component EscS
MLTLAILFVAKHVTVDARNQQLYVILIIEAPVDSGALTHQHALHLISISRTIGLAEAWFAGHIQ